MCRSKRKLQASVRWRGVFTILAAYLEQMSLMYLPVFNLSRPSIFQAVVVGLPQVSI
jgi:hypothetical protein